MIFDFRSPNGIDEEVLGEMKSFNDPRIEYLTNVGQIFLTLVGIIEQEGVG